MKYLIAGASGQLANAFITRFQRDETAFEAPPESVFDITNADAVEQTIERAKPDIILNCAAYNAVDAAEENPAPAFSINADAVATLATAAARQGALLVHYGSDYVFDGKTDTPYTEDAPANPLNQYGKSKFAGERAALETADEALVLRVSWVYGDGTQNFLHKMMQWSKGRDSLKIVHDQISVPTYTADIVEYTLKAVEKGLRGLFHLTNSGYAPRCEVAEYFFKSLRRDMQIIPVNSDEFPSPVQRPRFSAMSNAAISEKIGCEIPSWQNALERFVKNLELQ